MRPARVHVNGKIICAGCPNAMADWDFEDGELVVLIPRDISALSQRSENGMRMFYMPPSRRKAYKKRGQHVYRHQPHGPESRYYRITLDELPIAIECWKCHARTVSIIDLDALAGPLAVDAQRRRG